MSAADSIRDFLTPLLPLWKVQFGRWIDSGGTQRYAVLQPAGGLPAELLREPQFTLRLIGMLNESAQAISDAAETVIEAMRARTGAGLVFIQPSEPVFVPTDDGRPLFEIAVSAITT